LPLNAEEFRATLNPASIVNNRATVGGPQPAALERMLKLANQKLSEQDAWLKEKRDRINSSLARLDADFPQYVHDNDLSMSEVKLWMWRLVASRAFHQ